MGQWVLLMKEKVVKQPRMEWTGQKTPRSLHVAPLPGKSGHATLDPMVSICADREQNCSVGSMTAEKGAWKGPREEAAWSSGLMEDRSRQGQEGAGKEMEKVEERGSQGTRETQTHL